MKIEKLWDFCLHFEYDRDEVVAGVEGFLKTTRAGAILDCACGTGFVSLDLIKKGYPITCSDGSSKMLERFKDNAEQMGIQTQPHLYGWSELGGVFSERFDVVMCRGSSLIYAGAWDEGRTNDTDAIADALANFYDCLRPGGILYVDTTAETNLKLEGPQVVDYPEKRINGNKVRLVDRLVTDKDKKLRIWEPVIYVDGEPHTLQRYSYYMPHDELTDLLARCNFKDIRKIDVPGEHYAVFTARKE